MTAAATSFRYSYIYVSARCAEDTQEKQTSEGLALLCTQQSSQLQEGKKPTEKPQRVGAGNAVALL